MKYVLPQHLKEKLDTLPVGIQTKFWKQVSFLLQNLRHPSLRAKKYSESENIWQARVDQNYRFYFRIQKDLYVLLDIRPHPKR